MDKKLFRRIMRTLLVASIFVLTGCRSGNQTETNAAQNTGPIKVAFYPNESASEFEGAREEIRAIIQEATGRDVEIVTTTDYNVVVESIANGQVDLAYMGPEGYIEANRKNKHVQSILTNSGPNGTLDDALYYSFLAVREEDSRKYETNGGYTIDPIEGQTISFVSNTSTSGFTVPESKISSHFGLNGTNDLVMDNVFFDKVLFGGSHQGSIINLLKGDADVAAFMNMPQYFDVAEGEANRPGVVYEVKQEAEAPFDSYRGARVRVISSTPVLNGPIAANTENFTDEMLTKIIEAMTSDIAAENEKIFAPSDSEVIGMFTKEGNERYLEISDDFYDEIRELTN
ncbi:phosphate/phosphite/phosphonate ABC transporter, periplasmic binding protein [Enterococcus faecalis 13-SD-W-01]|nr:phosphate/phosphite/phosphonate ABC transporter, periplasmic binding protein [Enterococcus faecalis 13-SD-W-01]